MNPAIEVEEKTGPYNAYRTQAKALHGMVAPRAPVHCLQQAHMRIVRLVLPLT